MTNEQDSIYAGPLTDGLVQSNSGLQTMYRWNRRTKAESGIYSKTNIRLLFVF
jgi:hypothetical protein